MVQHAVQRIIERIDAGELLVCSHRVVRKLAAQLPALSPVGAETLSAFDAGHSVANAELAAKLWEKIESLPRDEQGGHRMLVNLLHPDEPINGYQAEYLIGWCQKEGVADAKIVSAFQG
jgi:hypothetical protein